MHPNYKNTFSFPKKNKENQKKTLVFQKNPDLEPTHGAGWLVGLALGEPKSGFVWKTNAFSGFSLDFFGKINVFWYFRSDTIQHPSVFNAWSCPELPGPAPELPGAAPSWVKLPRADWSCPELFRAAWSCSELSRAAQSCLELLRAVWNGSELSEASQSCLELTGLAQSWSINIVM